jgi:hypothetical protein
MLSLTAKGALFVYCSPGQLVRANALRRSVQTAMQISLGGIGGIIGTIVYRAQDAPRFIPGVSLIIFKEIMLANVDRCKASLSHWVLRCY